MNFLWRFVILDYKKDMLDIEEAKEFSEIKAFYEEDKMTFEDLKAAAAQAKEDKQVLVFSADDLRFVSFLENDFSKDEFTDIDHV
jgi:hypothetical protein